MPDNIVIEFKTAGLEDLVKAESALDKITQSGTEMGNEFKKNSDAINAGIKQTTTSLGALQKAEQDLIAIQKTSTQPEILKQVNAELGKVRAEMKAAGQSADSLSKDFKKVKDSVNFEAGKKTLEDFTKSINSTVTGSQKLTTQLRGMKQQLNEMELAGKGGSKAFRDLLRDAAKLEDQIGDTSRRIRALASDTRNIDAVVGVVSGLAGAFSAAQGAAALLGDENEDLQKALLKVQAAMALATGVQQVANTLQKDSAVVVTASAVAQRAYAIAVGTSTGALKVFRLALAATGVGLFLLAIGAIVTNFDKIKAKVIELFPVLNNLGDIWTGIKAAFLGTIAAFVNGLSGIGGAIAALFSRDLEGIKTSLASINLKKAFNDEVKATYDAAALAAKVGNEELVEAVVKGGDKVIEARKEVAKREVEEINKLPTNNPELAAEQQALVEQAKTGEVFIGAEERLRIYEEEERRKQNIRNLAAIGEQALFDFVMALSNNRISQIEKQAAAGVITEQKASREIAKIKRAQAIAAKGEAIFNIALNTPVAVSKLLAQLGIGGAIATPIILGLMALQLGAVIAQPIPQFAKGTENVTGGIKGKDSVLAMLMPGERIVPADINAKLGGIKNQDLPNLNLIPSMPYISDSTMTAMERSRGLNTTSNFKIDYDLLADKLSAKIEKHKKVMINIDERGFEKRVQEGLNTKKFWDDTFSYKG